MGSKRGHNEGSIYQMKNGKWRAQVTVGGRRLSAVQSSKKEAQLWLRQTLSQTDKGMTYGAAITPFGDFLKSYLENKKDGLRPSTYQQYSQVSNKYILPALGHVKFKDLRPALIQRFYDELVGRGVGKRVVQIVHAVVHSCLEQAEAIGLVLRNPSKGSAVPVFKKRKIEIWTESQVSAFMVAIQGHRNEYLFHLALTTGMRQGELLGLQWKDIEWQAQALMITRQVFSPLGGGYEFVDPKTERGRRTVELSAVDMDILRAQLAKVDLLRAFAGKRWVENDLVFPSSIGLRSPSAIFCMSSSTMLKWLVFRLSAFMTSGILPRR
jgi:integrase